MARSAAAVSVVKYGLPVPPAMITTRPFSRWRMARRRMYGSATSFISMAVWTRVATPMRSRESRRARAFITVAIMPMWSAVDLIHAAVDAHLAAPQIARADNDANLHAQVVDSFDAPGEERGLVGIDAVTADPGERFAA